MYELVPIAFHGADLRVVVDESDGYAAIAPICQHLGIGERGQRLRIQRHPVLQKGRNLMILPSAGGDQEFACLRIDLIPFWLATLHPSRARPEVRDLLILYQQECARVLFRHVAGGTRAKVLGSARMTEWKAARRCMNRQIYQARRRSIYLARAKIAPRSRKSWGEPRAR